MSPGRRLHAGWWPWLVWLLVGCTALPARPTVAQAPPVQRVAVTGEAGRMPPGERAALFQQLAAEGRGDLLKRHLGVMAAGGGVELYADNDAQLLVDGPAAFKAMFASVSAARQVIFLESYIIEDDELAQRLAELLLRKRQQGVGVFVLYDGIGSLTTDGGYFKRLADGGVAVCAFNPVTPGQARRRLAYGDITQRDHRKILAVDGQVAFTGGINISEVYSSGSFGRTRPSAQQGWRDTQVRLAGPAAQALETLVREAWVSQRCQGALPPARAAAARHDAGRKVVRIIPSSPEDVDNGMYTALLRAIDAAQRSVHLTMAYFAPGDVMVQALCEAAQRGVQVQLILPSVSDFKPVLHAGRSYYTQLLAAGVQVNEFADAVLHAKTAVIDGVWSTVGSSNLDWRSFTLNHEVNAVVLGDDFGRDMEAMFQRDLTASQRITPEAWAQRGVGQRLLQWGARLWERLW